MTSDALPLGIPSTLARLRSAGGAERDAAWADFVAAHSAVVLRTCRRVIRDYDGAMDAYAFVLEALRENDHHRLRAYAPDGRTQFATWLVVVTRRLALDHLRQRYGRARSEDADRKAEHTARRKLQDLLAAEVEPDQLPDRDGAGPEAALRRAELAARLDRAVGELPPEDRLLLVLRYVDERPVREIARALRLKTVFHAYRRLNATIALLRERLRRLGVDEAEP